VTTEQPKDQHASDIEELTAYLDGELDQADVARVEQRLGSDPDYLAEMQGLQQTWDLLDRLPETEPGASFTKTTMEMVVGEAVKNSKRSGGWVWPKRIAMLMGFPIALFALGYFVNLSLLKQQDNVLLDNLSVIDKYPYYSNVRNNESFVDGLMQLFAGQDSGAISFLIDEPADQDEQPSWLIPDGKEARAEYVKGLSPKDQKRLEDQMEDFLAKPESKQAALQGFDLSIRSSPDRDQRILVMMEYYQWLRDLRPDVRSEVIGLENEACLNRIAQIRFEQATQQSISGSTFDGLSPDCVKSIFNWYESICSKDNNLLFRQRLPIAAREFARKFGRSAPSDLKVSRHPHQLIKNLLQVDRRFIESTIFSDRNLEIRDLLLSEEAKEILSRNLPSQRRRLIMDWFEAANQAKFAIPLESLRKFEMDLGSEKKAELRSRKLSQKQYLNELQRMYRQEYSPKKNDADAEWESWLELNGLDFE